MQKDSMSLGDGSGSDGVSGGVGVGGAALVGPAQSVVQPCVAVGTE